MRKYTSITFTANRYGVYKSIWEKILLTLPLSGRFSISSVRIALWKQLCFPEILSASLQSHCMLVNCIEFHYPLLSIPGYFSLGQPPKWRILGVSVCVFWKYSFFPKLSVKFHYCTHNHVSTDISFNVSLPLEPLSNIYFWNTLAEHQNFRYLNSIHSFPLKYKLYYFLRNVHVWRSEINQLVFKVINFTVSLFFCPVFFRYKYSFKQQQKKKIRSYPWSFTWCIGLGIAENKSHIFT